MSNAFHHEGILTGLVGNGLVGSTSRWSRPAGRERPLLPRLQNAHKGMSVIFQRKLFASNKFAEGLRACGHSSLQENSQLCKLRMNAVNRSAPQDCWAVLG